MSMHLCSIERLSKRYGARIALDGIDLALHSGEVTGLVGPNGAGKTTLLRCLAGLVHPTSGLVSWATFDATGRVRVGYYGGEQTLPRRVTASGWLRLWGHPHAPSGADRPIGQLSRGSRQRVGLEAVLANVDFEAVLLDEPWEGLDPDASRWLAGAIAARRRTGTAVVVSSHRLHDLAEVCDRCITIAAGRIRSDITVEAARGSAARSAWLYNAFDAAQGRR